MMWHAEDVHEHVFHHVNSTVNPMRMHAKLTHSLTRSPTGRNGAAASESQQVCDTATEWLTGVSNPANAPILAAFQNRPLNLHAQRRTSVACPPGLHEVSKGFDTRCMHGPTATHPVRWDRRLGRMSLT